MDSMPYKDSERKKEWERLHRTERLARRRELRHVQAVGQTTRSVHGIERGSWFSRSACRWRCACCVESKARYGCGQFDVGCCRSLEKELDLVARGVRHFVYRI